MPAAREAAHVFQSCFRSLADQAKLEGDVAAAVEQRALLRTSDAFLALRAAERELASSMLLDLWTALCAFEVRHMRQADLELRAWSDSLTSDLKAIAVGSSDAFRSITESASTSVRTLMESIDYAEWHLLYNQAVEQVIALGSETEPVRTALRALMTRLELSQDELGRMLGVSGETIRRWDRGATGIPAERRAAILAAEAALRRLQDLFRPDRLPTAVRRPAELFDGERALDWILRGRIAEVADRYETALLYQA